MRFELALRRWGLYVFGRVTRHAAGATLEFHENPRRPEGEPVSFKRRWKAELWTYDRRDVAEGRIR